MRYHVFIDGCRDTTAAGVELVAAALGERYGMAGPALIRRLKEGRFCARASLELAPAQELVAELEAMGARASMVREAAEGTRDGGSARPPAQRYESGLAAAFQSDRLHSDLRMDLGALTALPDDGDAAGEGGGWELAHIDGTRETDNPAASPRARAGSTPQVTMRGTPTPTPLPGRRARPGSISGPRPVSPMEEAPAAREERPARTTASDPFQPPEEGVLALPALAEVPTRVAPVPAAAPRPIPVQGSASLPPASVLARLRDAMADSPRARFAAGVAVAFMFGLVPAQIYAWSRADSYEEIRAELVAEYRAADTPEKWAALGSAREAASELARSLQRRSAVSSCLLWLAAAGAVAFAWFRWIDWGVQVPAAQPDAARAVASRRRSTR